MKWSFASVGLIMLGLFGIVIIMLFNDITVSNEQDYYTLKYATEASMLEAVDIAYYRTTGELKISQEKFVENFTRRFTETSTFGQGNYDIVFYQINETPPKVSLRIYDKTSGYNIYTYTSDVETTQVNIVNELSAILEGTELDKEKKGYIINEGTNVTIGEQEIIDNTTCELKITVGKDTNGREIYRCVHADGSAVYKDITGRTVDEYEVDFDLSLPPENENLCVTELKYEGKIKGKTDQYAYSCKNNKGNILYRDKDGQPLSKNDIE